MANHDLHEHRILAQLEAGQHVTQRGLSRELGIALGLTNLLIRRLSRKGWVRIRRVNRSRLLYLITPAGIAAKARLTRAYVRDSIRFYRETRDRIRDELIALSAELQREGAGGPVVFYGAGEVAEIAYVCLQDTPLEFIGLVDPTCSKPFFTTTVCRPTDLVGNTLAGRSFARLLVMPVDDEEVQKVRTILTGRGVPPNSVFWL